MKPEPEGFWRVVEGSYMTIIAPAALRVCEKSPPRSRSVGTDAVVESARRSRSASKDTRKKVLSLMMGPLNTPPNCDRLKLNNCCPRRLSKKLFASNLELRRNS